MTRDQAIELAKQLILELDKINRLLDEAIARCEVSALLERVKA